ncbi:hypothetical protein C8R44DRAFT_866269 [Mycena epipterygia]|nr:hypothetical protein C8R44DRAFT_866269 [Mycena epipterygia]
MFAKTLGLFIAMAVVVHAVSISSRETCNRLYTVKPGDDCNSIAVENNVSIAQLLINLGGDCSTTLLVGPEDSCGSIEDERGIDATLLYAHNPQIDANCANLYIGEVLCVASTIDL